MIWSDTGSAWQVSDVARVDLVLLQRVVAAHGDLALGDQRAAGAAHAALAGERQVGPDPLGRVQDRGAGRDGHRGAAAVQQDGHLGARPGRGFLVLDLGRRSVLDIEQLPVDPARADIRGR